MCLYVIFVSDGDSSVTKQFKEVLSYRPDSIIKTIECRNHLLRNYSQKLIAVAKICAYPIPLRKYILLNII